MNKKGKVLTIFLICLYLLLAVAITILLVILLNKNINFTKTSFNIPSGKVSKNIVLNEKYNELNGNVNFDIEVGEIEINDSNTDEISVKIYADEDYIKEYKVDNNNLNIKVKSKDCVGLCINNVIPKVVVVLPSNYNGKIIINSNYGDVKIGSFENASLTAILDAGDIEIKNMGNISIDNKAGNIKISEVKDVNIKEKAGNIKIQSVDSVFIENAYGNIEINNVNKHMNLSSNCGNIDIVNANIIKDSKINCDLGNIKIKNISNVYVNAETNLGELKVNNNDRNSQINLNIRNKCGDIKVNN